LAQHSKQNSLDTCGGLMHHSAYRRARCPETHLIGLFARLTVSLLCLMIASLASADTLRCNTTIAPMANDDQGGYLFAVAATCNETFSEIELDAGGFQNGGGIILDGGEFVCRNASTCSGVARYTCVPP